MAIRELDVRELCHNCDPSRFDFTSTEELEIAEGVIDQERAVKSIEFGLGIRSKGYNIYVSGRTGTGKTTIVKQFVEKISESGAVPDDWLYVNNFKDPDRPLAINLPAGEGCRFKMDMMSFVEDLRHDLPKAFESEHYRERNRALSESYIEKKKKLVLKIEEEARERDFHIKSTPAGILTIPLVDGEEVTGEDYQALREDLRETIEEKQGELNTIVRETLREISLLDRKAKQEVGKLNKEVALFAVGHFIDELKDEYRDHPKVIGYLDDVREDILVNVDDFLADEDDQEAGVPGMDRGERPSVLSRYEVNLLVDNQYTKGAPVIFETNPTYANLAGQIEKKAQFGTLYTDFTMIKAGSILKANGGYLIVHAEDVLKSPMSYDVIKRVLKNDEIKIEEISEQYRLMSAGGPRPEPIPMAIKVVMLGSPAVFGLLYSNDDEFSKIFKVRADFSVLMGRTDETMNHYARFIATLCRNEGLRHFTPEAVAAVVDYGSRAVENSEKLSLRFGDIADIIRESCFWTEEEGSETVAALHVVKALEEKKYRSNMIEERIGELMEEGTIMVDVDGAVTGQVNGLSVYDLGDYSFGKPSRITVQTYMGKDGIINIERKAELSGRTHDKGVLILSGYLGGKYADSKPLSLSASVCFEQSDDMIDGDSASSTELYAILSSIADVPIKQSIAVTGSINQKGEIQPIGGVNQKIEGFFDVCVAKGLNGNQGVMIPEKNVRNLMLQERVVNAVKEGKFHIYPVEHADEGIEILTGVRVGEKGEDGAYPEGTINALVAEKLDRMAEDMKEYSPQPDDDGEEVGQ